MNNVAENWDRNLLQSLREATGAAHRRVERLLPVMSPTLTESQYVEVLKSFHKYYIYLDYLWTQDQNHLKPSWDVDFKKKSLWLEQDLLKLSILVDDKVLLEEPGFTGEEWWGVLYVTEGSCLGGQLITRQLQPRSWPLAFFTAYGCGIGPRWTSFLKQLSSVSLEKSLVTDAALRSFLLVEKYLMN